MDIAITGIGCTTPIGNSFAEYSESILFGKSGTVEYSFAKLEPSKEYPVAAVTEDLSTNFSNIKRQQLDRVTQMAIITSRRAISDSGIDLKAINCDMGGVFWGNSCGSNDSIVALYSQYYTTGQFKPSAVPLMMSNAGASQISIDLVITGPCVNIANACTSGSIAIEQACTMLEMGKLDFAIAGAAETPFAGYGLEAWIPTYALAKLNSGFPVSQICRPFSKDRPGLVLGEGSVTFILERTKDAVKRGARIYGRIIGSGNMSDAFNIVKPSSVGQTKAMKAALKDSNVDKIDYINAHATATVAGDPVEVVSIKQTFGDNTPPISSTKAYHGHLIGTAGAIELMSCLVSLNNNILIPNLHVSEFIDECASLDMIPKLRESKINTVLNNTFSFGGNNVCLVISK